MIDVEIDEDYPRNLRLDIGEDWEYMDCDEARDLAGRLLEAAAVLDRVEATRDRCTNYNPRRHRSPRWKYSCLELVMKKYRTTMAEALRPSTIWGIS